MPSFWSFWHAQDDSDEEDYMGEEEEEDDDEDNEDDEQEEEEGTNLGNYSFSLSFAISSFIRYFEIDARTIFVSCNITNWSFMQKCLPFEERKENTKMEERIKMLKIEGKSPLNGCKIRINNNNNCDAEWTAGNQINWPTNDRLQLVMWIYQ